MPELNQAQKDEANKVIDKMIADGKSTEEIKAWKQSFEQGLKKKDKTLEPEVVETKEKEPAPPTNLERREAPSTASPLVESKSDTSLAQRDGSSGYSTPEIYPDVLKEGSNVDQSNEEFIDTEALTSVDGLSDADRLVKFDTERYNKVLEENKVYDDVLNRAGWNPDEPVVSAFKKSSLDALTDDEKKNLNDTWIKRQENKKYLAEVNHQKELYNAENFYYNAGRYDWFKENYDLEAQQKLVDDQDVTSWFNVAVGKAQEAYNDFKNITIPELFGTLDDENIKEWINTGKEIIEGNESLRREYDRRALADEKITQLDETVKLAEFNAKESLSNIYKAQGKLFADRFEWKRKVESGEMDQDDAIRLDNLSIAAIKDAAAKHESEVGRLKNFQLGAEILYQESFYDRMGTTEALATGVYNEAVKIPRQIGTLALAVSPAIAALTPNMPSEAVFSLAIPIYKDLAKVTEEATLYVDPNQSDAALAGSVLFQVGGMMGSMGTMSNLAKGIGASGKALNAIEMMTGYTLGFAMSHDEFMSVASQESDLSMYELNRAATMYAVPAALLEYAGAKFGFDKFSKGTIVKNILRTFEKTGEDITERSFKKAFINTLEDLGVSSAIGSIEEGLTEASQNATMELAKWGYNKFLSKNPDATFKLSTWDDIKESTWDNFKVGAMAGAFFSGAGSIYQTGGTSQNAITRMLSNRRGYESLVKSNKLNLELGKIDQTTHDQILTNINDARHAVMVTQDISKPNDRKAAIKLSVEKSRLQAIEETSPATKARIAEINSKLSTIGANNTSGITSMTMDVMNELSMRFSGVDKVMTMIEENDSMVVTEGEEGKSVESTKTYKTAVKRAAREVNKEIERIQESGTTSEKQKLNELNLIRDELINNEGRNLYSPSTVESTKMSREDQKRAININDAVEVLKQRKDGVVTKKDVKELKRKLGAKGVAANSITSVEALEGLSVSDAISVLNQSSASLGKLSESNRAFMDVENISKSTGVEKSIVKDIRSKYVKSGLKGKEATNMTSLASKVVSTIAARTGQSKAEVYKTIDVVSEASKVTELTESDKSLQPLLQLANIYSEHLTQKEKDAVVKWAKEKEWNDKVATKFAYSFVNYLYTGSTSVNELKGAFRGLKNYVASVIGEVKGSSISGRMNATIRGIYADAIGDFNRANTIKIKERRAKLKRAVERQAKARNRINKRINKDNETVFGKENVIDPSFVKMQVERARKALAKTGLGINIVLHETNNEFKAATGRSSRGFWDGKGNVHINLEMAVNSTVAHEVFHGVLISTIKNKVAKANQVAVLEKITTDMVNSLSSREEFSEFADWAKENYTENINEESLAELTGFLAGNYQQLSLKAKDRVKVWINQMSTKLGLGKIFTGSSVTDAEVVSMLNTLSSSIAMGKDINTDPISFMAANIEGAIDPTTDVDTEEILERNQAFGLIKTSYLKDRKIYNQMIKDGLVVHNADLFDLADVFVATTSPDNMMVGEMELSSGTTVEFGGGVYYVLNTGNVWACADLGSAKSIANKINESLEKSPDGKGRLLLLRGTNEKMLTSVQGAKSGMMLLDNMTTKGLIPVRSLSTALKTASRKLDPKTGEKLYNIDIKGNLSLKDIHNEIKTQFLDVKNSTFPNRGTFLDSVLDELSKDAVVKENKVEILKAIGATNFGRQLKGAFREQLAAILTEPLLHGLPNGSAYAYIEVDSKVEPFETPEGETHESYPAAIRMIDENGNPSSKKPVLKLLENRPLGIDVLKTGDGQTLEELSNDPKYSGKNDNQKIGAFRGRLGLANTGWGTAVVRNDISSPKEQVRDDAWAKDFKGSLPKSKFKSKEEFQEFIKNGQWAMLTGENPQAISVSNEKNIENNKAAEKWLKENGFNNYVPIYGIYEGNHESSFLVKGMGKNDAARFARDLDQESVATNDGYIYGSEMMHPINKGNEDFSKRGDGGDFYSSVNVNGEIVDFSVDYDWGTEIEMGREQKATRGDVLSNAPEARFAIIKEKSVQRQNDEAAKKLADIDLVTIQRRFGEEAVEDILKVLEHYEKTGDPSFLNASGKGKNGRKKITLNGEETTIGEMDKYIAYDRVEKLKYENISWEKYAQSVGMVALTRGTMYLAGSLMHVMRGEMIGLSSENQGKVMAALGFFDFMNGASKATTYIEMANEFRLGINEKLKEYGLNNNSKDTQIFMARTAWLANLLAPSTKAHKNLDKWFDTVLGNTSVHIKTMEKRGGTRTKGYTYNESVNSAAGTSTIQRFLEGLQSEFQNDGKSMNDHWDEVIERIKEEFPKEFDILSRTAEMHKLQSDVVLNAKIKRGDKDTHAGEFYNSKKIRTGYRKEGVAELTFHEQSNYDRIFSETGTMTDRDIGAMSEGQMLVTWGWVDTQQRAYNANANDVWKTEFVRQFDAASQTDFIRDLLGQRSVDQIRDKFRSVVNVSGARDNMRLMEGNKNTLSNAWDWFSNLKNQTLITVKQSAIQALSPSSYAMTVAPRSMVKTAMDMGNVDNATNILRVFAEVSSLGGRNAGHFIDNATTSSLESTGVLVGNAPKWLSDKLLSSPDYAIAAQSWAAFYMQKRFEQSGKSWADFKKEFNWEAEAKDPNQAAAAFAEVNQQASQAPNIKEASSRFSTERNQMVAKLRETFMPFKYFGFSTSSELILTAQEAMYDKEARERLAGFATMPLVYASIKHASKLSILGLGLSLISSLLKDNDDDEENKMDKGHELFLRTMESAMQESWDKEASWEAYAESLAMQELTDFFFAGMYFDEAKNLTIREGLGRMNYYLGSGTIEETNIETGVTLINENAKYTSNYETFDEFINGDDPLLDVYSGAKNYDYLAPPFVAGARTLDAFMMWKDGYFLDKRGREVHLTPEEKTAAGDLALFGLVTVFIPLQEPRQIQKMTQKRFEGLFNGYGFKNVLDRGELNVEGFSEGSQPHLQLYEMWLNNQVVKNYSKDMPDNVEEALQENKYRATHNPSELRFNERKAEMLTTQKKMLDIMKGDKVGVLTVDEQERYKKEMMLYLEIWEGMKQKKGND